MRYQIELRPRIPSTSMSAGWRWRQHRRGAGPSSARSPAMRLLLGLGPGDLDERHRLLPPTGALRRLLRRAEPLRQVEQRLQRARRTARCPPTGRRPAPYRSRTASRVNSSGRQSGTSAQVSGVETRASSGRAHRVGGGDRAVLGVLVEVDEDALPLLLPPPARGQLGRPVLHLARHRLGGQPHVAVGPVRLDPGVDVEAARAGGLRPRGEPVVLQHLLGHQGDLDDLPPVDAGHRVEVDAQLVGVVEVLGQHRMRVEVDAAEVDHPGQRGGVADHHLLGRAARGVVQLRHLDPVGPARRCPLLEERLLVDALHEALEDHRPAGDPAQRAVRHREVVVDQVELGVPARREDHLVRVGDRHLTPGDLQHRRGRHAITIGATRASEEPASGQGVTRSARALAYGTRGSSARSCRARFAAASTGSSAGRSRRIAPRSHGSTSAQL